MRKFSRNDFPLPVAPSTSVCPTSPTWRLRAYGVPCVVAVNHFAGDSDKEIAYVEQVAREAGAEGAYFSDVHARGGAGGEELARAVVAAADKPSNFNYLYPLDLPIKDKIEIIAKKIYGASGVEYQPDAEKKIKLYNEPKVDAGRKNKDLYERLREDIDRSRQMYDERITEDVRKNSNYFYDELVRILADNDAGVLGL